MVKFIVVGMIGSGVFGSVVGLIFYSLYYVVSTCVVLGYIFGYFI